MENTTNECENVNWEERVNTEHNNYLRALADYQNYKRYADEKIASSRNEGKLSMVKDLLPLIDTFEQAIVNDENNDGLSIMHKAFTSYLATHNIVKVNVNVGDTFDENVAEAVGTIPTDDESKHNTIAFIMKPAYKFGDKIVRYASVMVNFYNN